MMKSGYKQAKNSGSEIYGSFLPATNSVPPINITLMKNNQIT